MTTLHVFLVDDGVETWVCAAHPGEAMQIMADTNGYESRALYVADVEPTITKLEPHAIIKVTLDIPVSIITDHPEVKDLPKGTQIVMTTIAHVVAKDYAAQGKRGILCCSEW